VLNGEPFKADLGLRKSIFNDFRKEYPGIQVKLFCSGGIFHDRYIILDYGTEHEKIFLCGASSKDAGARVTIRNSKVKSNIQLKYSNYAISGGAERIIMNNSGKSIFLAIAP